MLKNQLFGVEIEMTGITRKTVANVLGNVLGTTPSSPARNVYKTRTVKDSFNRVWKVMRDSSISPQTTESGEAEYCTNDNFRVELVTPPLNYDDIPLLQNIISSLRSAGAVTNNSCGIHIHIDGANHTPDSLRRLVNFMTERQDLFYEALEIGSRGFHWCKKLNSQILTDLKKERVLTKDKVEEIWYSQSNDNYMGGIDHTHYNSTRYHGINLHSYFSKNTVEFRLFNSTLNEDKVKAYIQLCLALSAWAITAENRISFHSMRNYNPSQKVTIMRNILINRLGLKGDEFKICRLYIMTPLKEAAKAAA